MSKCRFAMSFSALQKKDSVYVKKYEYILLYRVYYSSLRVEVTLFARSLCLVYYRLPVEKMYSEYSTPEVQDFKVAVLVL
jgi:hypothetical protein